MAIVNHLQPINLEKDSNHTETDCTYTIVSNSQGKFLQIDTYGSKTRTIPGKKSQSIRFSQDAIKQLMKIIKDNF